MAKKKGTLNPLKTLEQMPIDAPAINLPPHRYRGMELIIVEYTSDADSLAASLPAGMELTDTPTAVFILGDYHWSSFGPYLEVIMGIRAVFGGKPYMHIPYIYVTQEAPLIAGREIWGYPKKLAHMRLEKHSELYMGILDRPPGNRLATAVMRTATNLSAKDFVMQPITSLRVIPNVRERGRPDLAQLISCDFDVRPVIATDGVAELWSGPGSLTLTGNSVNDPIHRLPVKEIQTCVYGFFNAYLPYGKVLKEY